MLKTAFRFCLPTLLALALPLPVAQGSSAAKERLARLQSAFIAAAPAT